MSDTPDDFDDWLAQNKDGGKVGLPARAWNALPDEAREEIRRVLEMNDSGKTSVSAVAMHRRLKDHYQWTYSSGSLINCVKAHLGRKNWTHQ